jgi:DNA polymerase sigma
LYPPLESLTFILKKFIYVSGLSAPYKGGISSYALVLMIVAYMQNEYKLLELKQSKSEPLVADLLIGFLKFYGYKMNYVMKAIGLFDIHNPASWKNYTGCLSPYTDPKNPAIVCLYDI